MENAILVASKLSDAQFKFLLDEFGISRESFLALSDDDLDDLYDKIGFIEVAEIIEADKASRDLTERGKIAVSIVTLVGNELYSSNDEENDLGGEQSKVFVDMDFKGRNKLQYGYTDEMLKMDDLME